MLLVFCMLTSMLPIALAEETGNFVNGEEVSVEMPDTALDEATDDVMIVDLDAGELEQPDVVPSEESSAEEDATPVDKETSKYDNAGDTGIPKALTLGVGQTYALDTSRIAKGK